MRTYSAEILLRRHKKRDFWVGCNQIQPCGEYQLDIANNTKSGVVLTKFCTVFDLGEVLNHEGARFTHSVLRVLYQLSYEAKRNPVEIRDISRLDQLDGEVQHSRKGPKIEQNETL